MAKKKKSKLQSATVKVKPEVPNDALEILTDRATLMTKMIQGTGLLLGLLVLVVLRFYDLENKPIHFDESVNSWFIDQIRNNFFFAYDPTNYHGPFYFYWAYLWQSLLGPSLAVLRFSTSMWAFALPILFLFWSKNKKWYLLAAALVFMSPSVIFYGRSGIHESSFVFFQCVFLWCVAEVWQNQKNQIGLMLFAILLMATIKETFVLLVVPTVFLLIAMKKSRANLVLQSKSLKNETLQMKWLILGVVLFVVLFTGWAYSGIGLIDFVRAFLPWAKTGAKGAGHNKEFTYWISLFYTAEPTAILAGVILIFLGAKSYFLKNKEGLFWAMVGLLPLLIYSLIPYKTPWCLGSIVVPMYFAVSECLKFETKKIIITVCIISIPFLVVDAKNIFLSSLNNPIMMDHPFVYVQSTYQLKEVDHKLRGAMEQNPRLRNMPIQLNLPESWPFAWILRENQSLSYEPVSKVIVPNAWAYLIDPADEDIVRKANLKPLSATKFVSRQSGKEFLLLLREDLVQ